MDMELRRLFGIVFSLIILLAATGCGSDEDIHEHESEATRAIRMKVKDKMEKERLERHGTRIAHAAEAAASSATATDVGDLPIAKEMAASESKEGDAESGGGLAEGETLYAQNCASCHGARGAGDGPVSAGLDPKPAKHSDGVYMNALSNEHLVKVIKEGGTAVGKSALMAPWGGSMSDVQIQNVIDFMRTLASPPYQGSGA